MSAGLDLVFKSIALSIIGISLLLCIVRLVRGPSLSDRIWALDTFSIFSIAFVLVLGYATSFDFHVHIAVAMALVLFLATVAFARYILSRPSISSRLPRLSDDAMRPQNGERHE